MMVRKGSQRTRDGVGCISGVALLCKKGTQSSSHIFLKTDVFLKSVLRIRDMWIKTKK